MIRWSGEQPITKIDGENNRLEYIPLGVGAVIPPWNFPLAIMAGMTMAAIVAGNTVVLKPSSDAPTIAAKFVENLERDRLACRRRKFLNRQCGKQAKRWSPSADEVCLLYRLKQVGLHINEEAAKTRPGQRWINAWSPRWAERTRSS